MSPAPDQRSVVIDTTPLIALAAATDSLEIWLSADVIRFALAQSR